MQVRLVREFNNISCTAFFASIVSFPPSMLSFYATTIGNLAGDQSILTTHDAISSPDVFTKSVNLLATIESHVLDVEDEL